MTRRAAGLAIACALLLSCLLSPRAASAASPAPVTIKSTLYAPSSAYTGDTISVAGFGYIAGETVALYLDATQIGSTIAKRALSIVGDGGTAGRISTTVTIPDGASVGAYPLRGWADQRRLATVQPQPARELAADGLPFGGRPQQYQRDGHQPGQRLHPRF
jgi:hypothetical protein